MQLRTDLKLRLPPGLEALTRRLAGEEGRTMAGMIRKLMVEGLRGRGLGEEYERLTLEFARGGGRTHG